MASPRHRVAQDLPAVPQARLPKYVFMHNAQPQLRMLPGFVLLAPGNVPRSTSVSAGKDPTVYITFDIVESRRSPADGDGAAQFVARHKVVGDPSSRTEDFALEGVGARAGTSVSDVFEFDFFSTPVAVFHFDGDKGAALNRGLVAVASSAEADQAGNGGYGGHHQKWTEHGVFQTGRGLLAGDTGEASVLADLRAAIYRSIQTMLSSAPQKTQGEGCANVFTAEPGTCEVRQKQKNEHGHATLDITSSWLNKIAKVPPHAGSIYQGSHDHMGWKTGISGVYYATDGWSTREDGDDGGFITPGDPNPNRVCSRFNIMKPFRFDGYDSESNTFASIDPTPGTLLLFPSWLPHSADLHRGDEHRISIAFNVRLELGPEHTDINGFEFGIGPPPAKEFPVFVPDQHCTESLCKGYVAAHAEL